MIRTFYFLKGREKGIVYIISHFSYYFSKPFFSTLPILSPHFLLSLLQSLLLFSYPYHKSYKSLTNFLNPEARISNYPFPFYQILNEGNRGRKFASFVLFLLIPNFDILNVFPLNRELFLSWMFFLSLEEEFLL